MRFEWVNTINSESYLLHGKCSRNANCQFSSPPQRGLPSQSELRSSQLFTLMVPYFLPIRHLRQSVIDLREHYLPGSSPLLLETGRVGVSSESPWGLCPACSGDGCHPVTTVLCLVHLSQYFLKAEDWLTLKTISSFSWKKNQNNWQLGVP